MVYQNGDLEELKRRTLKLKGQRNMSFIAYHVSYLASFEADRQLCKYTNTPGVSFLINYNNYMYFLKRFYYNYITLPCYLQIYHYTIYITTSKYNQLFP